MRGYVEFLKSQLMAYQVPALWTKDWRTLFTLFAAGKNNPEVQNVRKAFDLERARLALGFTIWMILLWNDDWFSHLCSCSLRCVFSPKSQPQPEGQGQVATDGMAVGRLGANAYWQENIYFPVLSEGTSQAADNQNQGTQEHQMDAPAPEQPACHVSPQGQPCTRKSTPQDKLHLFGIVLAEIILVRPIQLDEQNLPTEA